MNSKARKCIGYGLLLFIFVMGMAIAAFYDLELSSALAGLSEMDGTLSLDVPPYAAALEIIGEWPAVLICAAALLIAASVLSDNHRKRAGFFYITAGGIAACLLLYGSVQTANSLMDYVPDILWAVFAACCLLLAAAGLIFIRKIPQKIRKRLFLPAVFTLAAALLIFFSVSALKMLWGRLRLRELVAIGSLDGFTPWYVPNFFSGSHSFPSGHTAHCTLMLMLPSWLPEKNRRAREVLTVLLAIFIGVMGISRLAAGAHYLSDVLFGFSIAFVITEWMKHVLRQKQQERPI